MMLGTGAGYSGFFASTELGAMPVTLSVVAVTCAEAGRLPFAKYELSRGMPLAARFSPVRAWRLGNVGLRFQASFETALWLGTSAHRDPAHT